MYVWAERVANSGDEKTTDFLTYHSNSVFPSIYSCTHPPLLHAAPTATASLLLTAPIHQKDLTVEGTKSLY